MSEEWSLANPLFDNVSPSMMCALRIAALLSDGIFADALRLNSLSPHNGKLLKFDPIKADGGSNTAAARLPVFCCSQNIHPTPAGAALIIQVGYKNHPWREKM